MRRSHLIITICFLSLIGFAVYNVEVNTINTTSNNQSHDNPISPAIGVSEDNNATSSSVSQLSSNHTSKLQNESDPFARLALREVKTELHQAVLEERKHFKRYPPENHRFESPEQDPVTQRYAVDERSTFNEDHTLGLTVWSDQKYYLHGDQVSVYAQVVDPDGNRLSTQFESTLIYDGNSISPVMMTDEDSDGIYQGVVDLSRIEDHVYEPGIYKVLIQANNHNLTDAITYTLSQPDIQLTGEFKDSINSDGHLVVETQIEITSTNRFYIQASLYSTTGVAIGVTQSSHFLESGTHWIPLTYAGLLIQDAQESGPYNLKQVSLAKVTMPMQRAPVLYPEYQTEAYGLDEFSSQPFDED